MWYFHFQTHFGTTILFCIYVFINTLLCAQLLLGFIITVSQNVDSYPSVTIYEALKSVTSRLPEKEKETLIEDFLTINFKLMELHEAIDNLHYWDGTDEQTSVAMLQQLGSSNNMVEPAGPVEVQPGQKMKAKV